MNAPEPTRFGHRFTILPDSGEVELHCGSHAPAAVVWKVGWHPSLDVLIGQAAAHNQSVHGEDPQQVVSDAIRSAALEQFGAVVSQITDETVGRKLAGIEAAVRVSERERIKGLFGEWITILMSEPNAHPPEAWIAAFAGLIEPKTEGEQS